MTSVVEYTLRSKPGEFGKVRDTYAAFVDGIEHTIADAELIMIVGEPEGGIVRGVGVYDSAVEVHNLPKMSFFTDFTAQVTPHVTGDADRIELSLEHLSVHADLTAPIPGEATLAEATYTPKPEHVDEFMARYLQLCESWITDVPDTRLLLVAANADRTFVRAFILYDHRVVADTITEDAALSDFREWAAPLMSEPLKRVEHRLIHLFLASAE